MDYIDKIITEDINSFLHHKLVCEMAMKPNRMRDKYGEVLDAIVDNLVCICLYPNSISVQHWKERAHGFCKRFVDLDIDPISKNNAGFRWKCFNTAVVEVLNEDFSAIHNHFKTVANFYLNKKDPHDRLIPYKPYEECYKENADRVKNAVLTLTKFVTEQDYNGMVKYMNDF